MARSASYWSGRRKKQLGRFVGKGGKALADPSVGNIARAAWSGVKYLRTLVNSEVHKFDTSLASSPSTSGTVIHLTGIANGDTLSTRTGSSILCKGLACRWYYTQHASATVTLLRVLFVQDRQQVGDTAPGVTDVLESASVNAMLQSAEVGRFKILSDETYTMDSVSRRIMFIRKYFRIQDHIRFNGTTGSDIQRNGLYCVLVSSEATNVPSVVGTARVSWHDN